MEANISARVMMMQNTALLPFDADADRYLGNAEYVMQKKNVTVLFCEDTDMPEDE